MSSESPKGFLTDIPAIIAQVATNVYTKSVKQHYRINKKQLDSTPI